jgi:WD domain, G-beta repeat
VAVTPDGRYVVSGSLDKTLRVWDLATGQTKTTLQGHTDWVNAVATALLELRAFSRIGRQRVPLSRFHRSRKTSLKPASANLCATSSTSYDELSYCSGKGRNLIRSRLHRNPFCSVVSSKCPNRKQIFQEDIPCLNRYPTGLDFSPRMFRTEWSKELCFDVDADSCPVLTAKSGL